MNSSKINSINLSPPIKCHQILAYPLGLLFNNDDSALPLLYSNFIQLVYKRDHTDLGFYSDDYWFSEKGLDIFEHFLLDLPQNILLDEGLVQIVEIIKRLIDKGFCVTGDFDEYYIPHRTAYQQYHFPHDYLINGYDTETNNFSLIGYTDKHFIEKTEASIPQYIAALQAPSTKLHFFKKNPKTIYRLDLDQIISSLKDYLQSKDSKAYYQFQADYVFGIDATNMLIEYLHLNEKDQQPLNLIHMYVLWEHKYTMYNRIEYLFKEGIVTDSTLSTQYKDIEEQAHTVLNLANKYNLQLKPRYLSTIANTLEKIQRSEPNVLSQLLEALCKIGQKY